MPLSSASNFTLRFVKLALEVLVAIDAELRVVGKIGAELQEERPEVVIDAIEIVVVDHGGRFDDPRIGGAGDPAAAPLGPHEACLLLRLADVKHALVACESSADTSA